ncbi:photosystem II repair protein PSB27-H1, chloroplastic-like [Cucurbita pepo subsp. pepo]|uniref:photosystem II repair protein PSB27-H1, chloroplastic-like n=1 Tax=Cucurbita pepo subsp. pepo TaxID=3664 RepID=UPI000C9D3F01|nr:photosystem II repair protein PSB27-H1, chloroplastic-like [Cucurbita pepo subsp. pepo]
MASPTLITPSTSKSQPLIVPLKPKSSITAAATTTTTHHYSRRREFLSLTASVLAPSWVLFPPAPALASSDEEYVKDTTEVIGKVRTTITMDKNDPNVAAAVAELRESSNSWVAKYRKEKSLLGRASFRDMYSALNAVSGHYISFGPTAPIPAKRKARILEEMATAEKALLRGR